MSGLNKISARHSFHTLTVPGNTFSIPLQEDYTLQGSTMSWTITDLALSEIAVLEAERKAFIRMGDDIYQIITSGATGGGSQSLDQVLNVGNTTSNSIVFQNAFGSTYSEIPYLGDYMRNKFDAGDSGLSQITFESGTVQLFAENLSHTYNSNLTVDAFGVGMASQDLINGIQGGFGIATSSHTYTTQAGSGVADTTSYKAFVSTSAGDPPLDIQLTSVPVSLEPTIVEVLIRAYGTTASNSYVGKLFAAFTASQIGVTDLIEKTTFTTATSDIYTDGSFIYVQLISDSDFAMRWQITSKIISEF